MLVVVAAAAAPATPFSLAMPFDCVDCDAMVDVDSTDSRPFNFFCDADSAANGEMILLLFGVTTPTGAVCPICETVLHKLPNGGYFDSTLSLSNCVV